MKWGHVFGALVLCLWLYNGYLENSLIMHPQNPNVTDGFVVPFNTKGKTVYITEREQLVDRATLYGSIAGAVLYVLLYKRVSKNAKTSPGKLLTPEALKNKAK